MSALYCIKNQNPNTIHKFLTAYLQNQRKIFPKITGWQNLLLESLYLFLMDEIHHYLKENHQHITKTLNF